MTSYQKLKAANAELQKQIQGMENAIADNDAAFLSAVRCTVKSRRSIGKLIWSGNTDGIGNGILTAIK